MAFMTTTIGDTEHGAEIVSGTHGEGWFTRRADGTWQQHRGHSQTPSFASEAQFRRWVLRETRDDRLGVMLPSSGRRIK